MKHLYAIILAMTILATAAWAGPAEMQFNQDWVGLSLALNHLQQSRQAYSAEASKAEADTAAAQKDLADTKAWWDKWWKSTYPHAAAPSASPVPPK